MGKHPRAGGSQPYTSHGRLTTASSQGRAKPASLKTHPKIHLEGLIQETNEIHVSKLQFEVSAIKAPRAKNAGC